MKRFIRFSRSICCVVLAMIMCLSYARYSAGAPTAVSGQTDGGEPRCVYLTFDDVPTVHTEKILDMLKENDMKATFFVLEVYIDKYPEVVSRILQEGHAIGLHGSSHKAELIYATDTSPVEEMDSVNQRLYELTGMKSSIVRTPYGSKPSMNQRQIDNLEKAGYTIWDWNVDTKDANGANVDPDAIYRRAVEGMKKQNNAIILMHNMKSSKNALPKILKYIKENNIQTKVITSDDKAYSFTNLTK